MAVSTSTPAIPIAISCIGDRYLLFDIDAISWLRRNHNICGVFIGTLPQNPSQNLFMGLPLQIMIEEAQLLIELGVAYILNDAKAHDVALAYANSSNCAHYLAEVEQKVVEISSAKSKQKEASVRKAMKKINSKIQRQDITETETIEGQNQRLSTVIDEDDSLFTSPLESVTSISPITSKQTSTPGVADTSCRIRLQVTPTTSATLISASADQTSTERILPNLSASSYALYRHLHQTRTFFHTPGLRFGSQFSIYPGDPLRFHAHFLGVGLDWEQEIDLMDIVGGGRLGTGVKKGYLLGAREPARNSRPVILGEGSEDGKMRCFSLEWAGM